MHKKKLLQKIYDLHQEHKLKSLLITLTDNACNYFTNEDESSSDWVALKDIDIFFDSENMDFDINYKNISFFAITEDHEKEWENYLIIEIEEENKIIISKTDGSFFDISVKYE